MSERKPHPGDPPRPSLDELIDRGDAKALAERGRESQAERRHIDVQARIDQSLRRIFAEPELNIAAPVSRRLVLTRWLPLAAAAAVLLAGLVGWRLWTVSNRPDLLGPLYRQIVDAGFKPDAVCTTDEEFAGWCRSYLRQPMYPTSRPEGLQYVGWSTGPVLGKVSAILLAKVNERPILVVMERTDRLTKIPGEVREPGLRAFHRRIGDVVMYEVTPEPRETILPVIARQPVR